MKLLALVVASTFALPVLAERWDGNNSPNKISNVTKKSLVTRFESLPLKAELSNDSYIWSDTYWPSNRGGISYRWNDEPNNNYFKYRYMTESEVKRASIAQLEKLSPAEKFDIYNGDYDYSFTKKVKALYHLGDAWWEGICHGWSAAAVNHPEPQRVVRTSKDGVDVPFGSSDVKGLLSFYYAKGHTKYSNFQIGKRCSARGKVPEEAQREDTYKDLPTSGMNAPECNDINAGAFHLVITNMIGINDKGFVAEVDRFNDVWNQPVGKYDSWIVGERAATPREASEGAARIVRVRLDMTYGDELYLLDQQSREDALEEPGGFMSMDPVTGTPDQTVAVRKYEYTLELDRNGNIIGGEWISVTRPDFLWSKTGATSFGSGKGFDFKGLNNIYVPVR